MLRTLTVTTPASDPQLLTIEEMRAAVGVTDNSQDTALTARGLKVAADIAVECRIAIGSGSVPTLRRETLTEVYRGVELETLILSRRHDVTITSVTEDDIVLDAADYLVDPEKGLLWRLCDDDVTHWCASKITVVYDAGFDTIPADLKDAASEFFRASWLAAQRDPLVKGQETDIPGVMRKRTDYWVGAVPGQSNDGAVPDAVEGKLQRYRDGVVG